MAFNDSFLSPRVAPYGAGMASSTSWPLAEGLLEASMPGFTMFSGIAKTYFQLDLTSMLAYILPLAALSASLHYIYRPIYDAFLGYCVSTMEIRNDDESYNYLMYWLSQQEFAANTTKFIGTTTTDSEMVYNYDYEEGDSSNSKNDDIEADWSLADTDFGAYWAKLTTRDRSKPLFYTPREGTHYFRHNGHWLSLIRQMDEKQNGRSYMRMENLFLRCLGRDPTPLKALLQEAQVLYVDRDKHKTVVYRKHADCTYWQRCLARTPRALSTVVLDAEQKQAVIEDIKEYLHPLTKRWYANRGIPYRRGYLLHGPPGTGKTSLCVALAGLFRLKVYVVSLDSKALTEDILASLFSYLPQRCIVLLEDVDTAGITKKRAPDADNAKKADNDDDDEKCDDKTSGISLSGLLNVIDGVASVEGRILIMTTNHPEKLDAALLRPGRVDMSVKFDNASFEVTKELFISTYINREDDLPIMVKENRCGLSSSPTRAGRFSESHVAELASQFARIMPGGEFSPAALQGYLMNYKTAPETAVKNLGDWVEKTRKEREEMRLAKEKSDKKSKPDDKKANGKASSSTSSIMTTGWASLLG